MSDNSTNGSGKPAAAFIRSELDDYGLTVSQFRVYCHVARCGECFAKLSTIAQKCRMHRDTVIECLNFLVQKNLLFKESRPGSTSLYRATRIADWKPIGNQGAPETNGHPLNSDGGYTKIVGTIPPETKGHKGNLREVTPPKACKLQAQLRQENELLKRAKTILGLEVVNNSGGLYRNLIRENSAKFERVLDSIEEEKKPPYNKMFTNIGGYFYQQFTEVFQ